MTTHTVFFAKISVSIAVAGTIALLAITYASAAPAATLTASNTDLRQGESVTLTWSSSDATTCTGTGFSTGGATSGSVTVTPVDDTSYAVVCTKQSLTWAKTSGPTTTNVGGSCTGGLTQAGTCPAQVGNACATLNSTCTTTFRDPDAGFCRTTRTTYQCQGTTQSASASTAVTVRDVSVTLVSNPGTITSGGGATLSWGVTGATTCTSNGFNWASRMSGSATVYPTDSTAYSLVCNNGTPQVSGTWQFRESDASDLSCPANASCRPYGNNDPRLPYGSMPACSPTNPTGTSCTQSGALCRNGYWSLNANQSPYMTDIYECTATGSTGTSDVDSATVTVQQPPPPTASLTLSPNSIAYGGSSTVSWSSTNATTCTGANFSTGGATSGSVGVSATQSTTYTVYCSGPGGDASDAKTLTVGAQPFPDLVSYVGSTVTTIAGQSGTYGGSTSNIGNAATGAFNDLFVFYNADQYYWNGYVRVSGSPLGAGASASRSTAYTFSTPGTYYYRLCADWDGYVGESNEGNNCSAFSTAYVRPAPPTGLVHSCNANGTQVTLSWTAPSSGADNYYVRMTGTSSDGYTGTSITYPVTPGQYYDWWVHSNIGAANYDSNRYSDAVSSGFTCNGAADLTAGSVTPTSATAGTAVSLSATASNTGNATSGSFPLLFQVSETGALMNSTYLAGIAAGGNSSGSASYTFPSAGSYSVRACANYNTAWTAIVTESNYGNNCGPWTTVNVAAAQVPAVSCTVSPSSIPSGASVTYNANPSGGATGPYTWTAGDGGSYGSASSVTRVLTTPGIYAMNVRASNTAVSYCPDASVAATWCTNSSTDLNITATPDRVRAGQSVVVAWSASGVNGQNASCSVSGPGVSWSSAVSAAPVCSVSGSANPTISTQSTYTLTCGGVSESVTVNVIPNFQEF